MSAQRHHTPMPADPDATTTAAMMLQVVGEPWRCDERTVEAAMRPGWRLQLDDLDALDSGMRAMLQTGAVFVLDLDRVDEVLRSQPPELPELPPLPFPRVLIEGRRDPVNLDDDQEWLGPGPRVANQPLMVFRDQGVVDSASGDISYAHVAIWLVALVEHVQGLDWDVYCCFSSSTNPDYIAAAAFRATPGGIIESSMTAGAHQVGVGVDSTHETVLRMALNCAHVLTAKGVPHEPILLPRPVRRRYKKRYQMEMPRAYFVNLRAAGEEGHVGHGDREYHVRWMVRGHWRHHASGERSWIRPYIKGPAGAPWKGRPIHIDR